MGGASLLIRQRVTLLCLGAILGAAYVLGVLESTERALIDSRFRLLSRPASDSLVVVEIDSRSLHELGTWPWPRGYHAALIDNLFAAGAVAVALDIDLSASSAPEADQALAAALSRAKVPVILPAFAQPSNGAAHPDEIVYTYPSPLFRSAARIGAVNVFPDADSLVRRHAPEILFDNGPLMSSPMLLFGGPAPGTGDFYLDFGIRLDTIPRISYADVLKRRFDPAAIAGKKVIVGATAVELGDQFGVPLYHTTAGPRLQALAYETLYQGRAIHRSGAVPTLALALAVLLLTAWPLASWPWRRGLGCLLAILLALYAGALLLQRAVPYSLDLAPAGAGALLLYGIGIVRAIERQALELVDRGASDDRRRAMMHGVLEDSFDGIIIARADGTIELANPAAARLLKHRAEDMAGKPIDLFLPGASRLHARLEAPGLDPPHAPVADPPSERQLTLPDGTVRTVEHLARCSTLRTAGYRRERPATSTRVFIHTFRDISERKLAEAKMRDAMQQALLASRAKTEFLANMSHELRTPLNAIIGFSEIMVREALGRLPNEHYREYVADILDCGSHLREIIDDILDVSRIEAGHFTASDDRVDLAETIAKCLKLIKGRAFGAAPKIRDETAADLPVIRADARLVKQVVLNLLSNAVKFTPPDGWVTIAAALEEGRVVLCVTDTGIGIPAEHLADVTKPFFQVDAGLARQRDGTGLGLALVAAYAKLHEAELAIESAVGRGTRVSLRFPRERTLNDRPAAARPPLAAAASG